MLVSKNAKICVSPNAKPQHESVEYTQRKILLLAMYISFCLCRFPSRWAPFFSGMWALRWFSNPRGQYINVLVDTSGHLDLLSAIESLQPIFHCEAKLLALGPTRIVFRNQHLYFIPSYFVDYFISLDSQKNKLLGYSIYINIGKQTVK